MREQGSISYLERGIPFEGTAANTHHQLMPNILRDPWAFLFKPAEGLLCDKSAQVQAAEIKNTPGSHHGSDLVAGFEFDHIGTDADLEAAAKQAPAMNQPAPEPNPKTSNGAIAELALSVLFVASVLLMCFGVDRKSVGRTFPALASIDLFRPDPKPAERPQLPKDPAVLVWVDRSTALYYCAGTDYFGQTRNGVYMTQGEALLSLYQPADRKGCRAEPSVAASSQFVPTDNGPAKQTAQLH